MPSISVQYSTLVEEKANIVLSVQSFLWVINLNQNFKLANNI
jgi:hypothetical protein